MYNRITPNTKEAYELFHNSNIVLSEMTMHGVKINTKKLNQVKLDFEKKARILCKKIDKTKEGVIWKKKYRSKTEYTNNNQLGNILYNILGVKQDKKTDKGNLSTDNAALQFIAKEYKFVDYYLQLTAVSTVLSTFINGLSGVTVDGRIHPSFNLHNVKTYRSSSNNPNFQNFPKHGIGYAVRECIVPDSSKYVLYENDYSGMEVHLACCYHKDANMLRFIHEGFDMHKMEACACYKLSEEECTDALRYNGKNCFVFPGFYGQGPENMAARLWENAVDAKLKTSSGIPILQHLKNKGIGDQKSFGSNVRNVFDDYWNNKYSEYGQWREDVWNYYQDTMRIEYLTGFTVEGLFRYQQVINMQVQGTAFHALLKGLIRLYRCLKKYRMKTRLVGQIHDALVANVHIDEEKQYRELLYENMVEYVGKVYKSWLNVPIHITIDRGEHWGAMKQIAGED